MQYLFLPSCLSCGFLPHYNGSLFAQAVLIPSFLIVIGAQGREVWGTLTQPKHVPFTIPGNLIPKALPITRKAFRVLASLQTHLLLLCDRVWVLGDGI